MDSGMIVRRGTDQLGICRDGQNALHALQIDGTHMLDRFDQLLLANAIEQGFFALQSGYGHRYPPRLPVMDSATTDVPLLLPYLHMDISNCMQIGRASCRERV